MRDLDKALADITAMRAQMARGTEFQGYGPITVAATCVLALLAAVLVLGTISLAATLVPARRAALVDPAVALRAE